MFPYLDAGKRIPTYGLCFLLGMVAAVLAALFLDGRKRVRREDLIYGAAIAIVCGLAGAKLLSVLPNLGAIIENRIPLADVLKNGFVFYGGVIGGALGIFGYCWAYKVDFLDFLDTAALGLPLGSLFGRIGCFASGCCYGRPTDSFLGVVFSNPADPNTPTGVPLLPTQLFESGYCLLIFLVLLLLNRRAVRGRNVIFYLISYSVCRFVNEFFRADAARGFLLGMSTSQLISVLLIVASLILWILLRRGFFAKKTPVQDNPA